MAWRGSLNYPLPVLYGPKGELTNPVYHQVIHILPDKVAERDVQMTFSSDLPCDQDCDVAGTLILNNVQGYQNLHTH